MNATTRGGVIAVVEPESFAAEIGLQVGDEIIEVNGQPVEDVIDVQFYVLIEEAESLCSLASRQAVLKILVTSGSGGTGYRRPEPMQATRILSLHPFPDYPTTYTKQGVNLRICRTRLGMNSTLAGIKHLNRLEQVLARSEWNSPDIQEGLMLDSSGNMIEGTMTNLFYIQGRVIYTASLAECGIAGITRGMIMTLAKKNRLDVHELIFPPEQLFSADEVFICNSIIGIWPVKRIEKILFPVGTLTQQLQQWLADHKLRDLLQ